VLRHHSRNGTEEWARTRAVYKTKAAPCRENVLQVSISRAERTLRSEALGPPWALQLTHDNVLEDL
jgi:hypothetical protein